MRLPQDLANLLAVAIRDLIWYKRNVYSFLEECSVPKSIMLELQRMPRNTETVKKVHYVLNQLAKKGEEGFEISLRILTKVYYWKDLHTVSHDRKEQAVQSLKALREGYDRYRAEREHQREKEKKMHAERVQRIRISGLDHGRFQAFRDEFDRIHAMTDPHQRGNLFEDLMNRIFDYYCEESKGPFKRTGEQIDGAFYFDKHWYYVEIRWTKEQASAADVSVLRDRAKDAFGGDTKALFISFNGFTRECLESLRGKCDERVVLMDGCDLHCVLDCQIAFDVLIAEKQGAVVQNREPFVTANEIIQTRGKK
ncbi:MAG: hypothetical protein FJY66_01920 [Calditrichaeota bacterium]|nr:hypothetical protein [Calditrichota bacterium]